MTEGEVRTKRRKIGPWLLVLATIVLSVVSYHGIAWLTQPPEIAVQEEPVAVLTVDTEAVQETVFPVTLSITGTVEARERIEVGSEVSGLRIVEVLVEEGDRVSAGQPLVRLNQDLLRARQEQLKARYEQQEAGVAKARQPERPLEIAQLRSAWQQAVAFVDQQRADQAVAEAALRDAERNFQRFQSLLNEGAVPRSDFNQRELEIAQARGQVDAAKTRLVSAEFAAKQARDRLALSEQGGRQEDISIAKSQLRELSAQLDEVQAQLDQTNILAPVAGWVLEREARLGDIASSGKTLVVLAQGGEIELKGQLPETMLRSISIGQKVFVLRDEKKLEGRIYRISPQVDPATRNAEVRIELPSNQGLLPGMFVEAQVQLKEQKTLAVPVEAVFGENPNTHVFVANDGKVEKRVVQLGERSQGHVAVLSGLKVGEEVVVRGGGFLRDGDPVQHS